MPDTDWILKLENTLSQYPAARESSSRASTTQVTQHGNDFELVFAFGDSLHDRIDQLLVEFVANRLKAKQLPISDSKSTTLSYRCSEDQAKGFGRYLLYASTIPMAKLPRKRRLGEIDLPTLITQTLHLYKKSYSENLPRNGVASLEIYSNVLRPLSKKPIGFDELIQQTICTHRTLTSVLKWVQKLGWIDADAGFSPQRKRPIWLTPEGQKIKRATQKHIEYTEENWQASFKGSYKTLRSNLESAVSKFDLEYPHYITGYGPADEALTGGNYLPAEKGPPRVPGRGEQFPVVERRKTNENANLPLFTLLSQTLTEFVIDYEEKLLGRLGLTALFFKYLPDEGMPLEEARQHDYIKGDGTSLHERHLNIVITPGQPKDGTRTVYPTSKTRRARDAHFATLIKTEKDWQSRFGTRRIEQIRKSLVRISDKLDDDIPDYPDTTAWMRPWQMPFHLIK